MTWILIVAIGGFINVADVKHIEMTEPQCKAAIRLMAPLAGKFGAGCVGPRGETFTFDDLKETEK